MCRMTDTGFRWAETIPVPLIPTLWYVYERAPGEQRYSRQMEPEFKPLYAIRIRENKPTRNAWRSYLNDGFIQ